jgi:hypothetical protein
MGSPLNLAPKYKKKNNNNNNKNPDIKLVELSMLVLSLEYF